MTTTTLPDLRPALERALDQVESLIAGTDPAQAERPTPCSEYDVTALIAHLQAVVRRIGVVLAGRPFWETPREIASASPAAWLADWRAGRAETEQVLADDAILAREVTVPWGTVTGAAALGSYVGELTVHSWDLARATGRENELDAGLAAASYAAYREKVPAEPRGGEIPFGPVVPVADDAGPYERLIAWTGRDPRWEAATS